MFLSEEEIRELSGYKKSSCQIKFLNDHGIKNIVGVDGKPKVLRSHIEAIMGGSVTKTKRRIEPDEAALDRYMGLA